jgi:hypothetical protein
MKKFVMIGIAVAGAIGVAVASKWLLDNRGEVSARVEPWADSVGAAATHAAATARQDAAAVRTTVDGAVEGAAERGRDLIGHPKGA